jgi:hypothetical protein
VHGHRSVQRVMVDGLAYDDRDVSDGCVRVGMPNTREARSIALNLAGVVELHDEILGYSAWYASLVNR